MCPTCGSDSGFNDLGRLGRIHWVRCIACGDTVDLADVDSTHVEDED